jgi:hypothetical protein
MDFKAEKDTYKVNGLLEWSKNTTIQIIKSKEERGNLIKIYKYNTSYQEDIESKLTPTNFSRNEISVGDYLIKLKFFDIFYKNGVYSFNLTKGKKPITQYIKNTADSDIESFIFMFPNSIKENSLWIFDSFYIEKKNINGKICGLCDFSSGFIVTDMMFKELWSMQMYFNTTLFKNDKISYNTDVNKVCDKLVNFLEDSLSVLANLVFCASLGPFQLATFRHDFMDSLNKMENISKYKRANYSIIPVKPYKNLFESEKLVDIICNYYDYYNSLIKMKDDIIITKGTISNSYFSRYDGVKRRHSSLEEISNFVNILDRTIQISTFKIYDAYLENAISTADLEFILKNTKNSCYVWED